MKKWGRRYLEEEELWVGFWCESGLSGLPQLLELPMRNHLASWKSSRPQSARTWKLCHWFLRGSWGQRSGRRNCRLARWRTFLRSSGLWVNLGSYWMRTLGLKSKRRWRQWRNWISIELSEVARRFQGRRKSNFQLGPTRWAPLLRGVPFGLGGAPWGRLERFHFATWRYKLTE